MLVTPLLRLLLPVLAFSAAPRVAATPVIVAVDAPVVALVGRTLQLVLHLAWSPDTPTVLPAANTTANAAANATANSSAVSVIDSNVTYAVRTDDAAATLLASGSFPRLDADGMLSTTVKIQPFVVDQAAALKMRVTVGAPAAGAPAPVPGIGPDIAATHVIPGWLTLISVVILIALALITKQVLTALFAGVFVSATIIHNYNPLTGFLRAADDYMVRAIADPEHVKVLLFTWWLAGLIALVQRSGGAQGLAQLVTKYATTRWKGLWVTFALGCLIFFDDFASCLIVGTNMVAVTDALGVSREKLSFVVHATSSPPASIAPLSSWIGYEVGLIAAELKKIGSPMDAFVVFLRTIPSRFYPIYMLAFVVWLNATKRDFGPMLTAERRACHEGRVSPTTPAATSDKDGDAPGEEHNDDHEEDMIKPVPGKPRRWLNAVIPIALNVVLIVVGIFVTGYYATVKKIAEGDPKVHLDAATLAGNGDSYGSLIYASLFSSIAAIVMYKCQRILDVSDALLNWTKGLKEVVEPVLILILAWSMGTAMNDLQTAEFIVSGLQSSLDPRTLPTLVFLTSCIISFVTGTSWGTMAVLFPLAIPLADALHKGSNELIVEVTASILTGAIFGDQCSPISGTSVMSALASRCPLADHVKTQFPYAMAVAIASIVFGYIPVGFGAYPAWAADLIGVFAVGGIVFLLGSKVEDEGDGGIVTRLMSFPASITAFFTRLLSFLSRRFGRSRRTPKSTIHSDSTVALSEKI